MKWYAIAFVQGLPLLVPGLFLAYAVGKRQFGLAALFWLVTCESVAIWLAIWLPKVLAEHLPMG